MSLWIAGCNQPGYMPDNTPEEFATQDGAKRYIIGLLKIAEDEAETEEDAETIYAFAENVNLQSGEFSAVCVHSYGRWVYWVTKE